MNFRTGSGKFLRFFSLSETISYRSIGDRFVYRIPNGNDNTIYRKLNGRSHVRVKGLTNRHITRIF